MRELLSIAYLRGGAASFIVLFHAAGRDDVMGSGPLEAIFALGASRVDMFFVISGFALWLSMTTKDHRPGPFFAQRVLRIAPLYWIVTLLLGGGAMLLPGLFPNLKPTLQDLLLSLAFVPHFSATRPDKIWPIVVQGWALHYEMIFYVVLTLVLFVGRALRLAALAAILVGLAVAGVLFRPTSAVGITLTDPVLLEFLGGALFAAWWAKGGRASRPVAFGLLVAAAAALVVGTVLAQTHVSIRALLLGGPALMLVAATVLLEQGRKWPVLPRLLAVGRASYSIYLLHGFVISVIARIWIKSGLPTGTVPSGLVFVALCTVGSVLVGLVAFRFVEKPLADRLRRPAASGFASGAPPARQEI